MKARTILFDINETVLNLAALQPRFKQAFKSDAALSLWFAKLLHASTVCISTQVKTTFADLARAGLESLGIHYNTKLSEDTLNTLLSGFASLPAHADIKDALKMLQSNGYKTVAFSNSSLGLITAQIENAGLHPYFDQVISVEQTGSFKPDPKVYQFAANTLDEPLHMLRLVATHDWDTHGALSAGMKAAYIDRCGAPYHPLYLRPDIHGKSMGEIAQRIIQLAD